LEEQQEVQLKTQQATIFGLAKLADSRDKYTGEHLDRIRTLCREIALSHHERYDGSGYPHGLKGEEIPLSARIVAVADTYDALTSDRCYQPERPHAEAAEIITQERGAQFHPDVVDAFLRIQDRLKGLIRCAPEEKA
jgi:HD-GYP domain-containing protein (c-di-GMP phosphodiesterase class II)